MTENSKIFNVSTLSTMEYGPLAPTLNIKPHLDPLSIIYFED